MARSERPATTMPKGPPSAAFVHAIDDPFPPGSRLGDYVVRAVLGGGGMGTVYEAFDPRLARTVAIKVPNGEGIVRDRLLEEARALASLRHAGLVTVHALGEQEGMPFVVMERISGTTLLRYLGKRADRGETLTVSEALDVLVPIAEVLAVVHRAGLAHRDVKPSNVMIAPGGRVVLMDFGLFQTDASGDAALATAGTPHYIAPETVTATVAERQGHLVDVYALGCVAFELLTGATPFDGEDARAILRAHVEDPPPPLRSRRGDVPEALASLIDRMLAKDPLDRPHDMESVAWALRRVRGAQPQDAHEISVLIVEDDAAIAKLMELRIRKGVPTARVERFGDAIEALERLATFCPDVLVLDLHMPRMSGMELAMYLKSTPFFEKCVTIAVSAGASDADRALLRDLGITRFVAKGTEFGEKLVEHVRQLALNLR